MKKLLKRKADHKGRFALVELGSQELTVAVLNNGLYIVGIDADLVQRSALNLEQTIEG